MNSSYDSPNPASTSATDSGAASNESGGTLGAAKQKITDATRNTVSSIKSAATDAATRAKDQAATMVGERKSEVADRLGAYGSAIHKSAESIEGEDPNIAWLTHRAADRLNGIADYVRTRDLQQLKGDAEDLARRHPAAFFGGMFVAGLVIGNVIKATQRPRVDSTSLNEPERYPQAENVPSGDQPGEDPWPAEPRAETL